MLITSFLAPSAGTAIVNFFIVDWKDANILFRLVGSIVGAPVLVIFVLFITIPFGFVTYTFCLILSESRVANRVSWAIGGTIIGTAFGAFMALWASISEVALLSIGGAVIGLASGLLLWRLWIPASSQRPL